MLVEKVFFAYSYVSNNCVLHAHISCYKIHLTRTYKILQCYYNAHEGGAAVAKRLKAAEHRFVEKKLG